MSGTARSTAKHRLEWLLLKGAIAHLRRGEMADAHRRTRALTPLLRRILRKEWAWARTNLKLVYGPALDDDRCRRLAAMAFDHIVLTHVDAMRVADIRFEPDDLTPLHEALKAGRGVILCGVHLGTWDVALKRMSMENMPVSVVYRHANNPLSEAEFIAARAPYGVAWIRRDNSRGVLQALKENRILVLQTDINQREGGVTAPFLGIPAQCPPGPARLAMRFQAPLVPAVALRTGAGRVQTLVGQPLEPPARGGDDAMIAALTGRINQAMAPWIHTYAEQYNWLHARWRSRPDGTLWRPDAPLATLWQARTEPHPPLSDRVRGLLG